MIRPVAHRADPGVGGGPERLHALDALRAFAMFLGVIYHAGLAYMVASGADWPRATQRSVAFNFGFVALHGFRMPLFFVTCGFFGRLLLCRLGAGWFVRHRARRIALPLALGMLTVAPLVNLTWNFSLHRSWPGAFRWTRAHFIGGPDHLWFLYYLLIYYAASLLVAPLLRRLLPAAFQQNADRRSVALVRSPWLLLVLVLATSIPLASTATGLLIDAPDFWRPVPRAVCYYAIFYIFGWLLHRNTPLLQEFKRAWVGHAAVAAGLFAVCLVLGRTPVHPHPASLPWPKWEAALAYSGFVWSSVFAFLILFLRYVDVPSGRVRYYADASYWFYLVHLPVVLLLQAYLNPSHSNVFAQFLVVLIVTLLFCAITYRYGVRFTWIGTLLNGRRERTT